MISKLEYSFDDEVVSKFCYDMDNKRIEVHFTGYFDLLKNEYIETPCIWFIENWLEAKSKIDGGVKFEDLDKNIGVFSMILSIEKEDKDLTLYINTVDNRYITLFFKDPKLSLK